MDCPHSPKSYIATSLTRRGCWELQLSKMASCINTGLEGKAKNASNADLLLHPELLSQEFMQMLLHEVRVRVDKFKSWVE